MRSRILLYVIPGRRLKEPCEERSELISVARLSKRKTGSYVCWPRILTQC
jgi:hypothetical protein